MLQPRPVCHQTLHAVSDEHEARRHLAMLTLHAKYPL